MNDRYDRFIMLLLSCVSSRSADRSNVSKSGDTGYSFDFIVTIVVPLLHTTCTGNIKDPNERRVPLDRKYRTRGQIQVNALYDYWSSSRSGEIDEFRALPRSELY